MPLKHSPKAFFSIAAAGLALAVAGGAFVHSASAQQAAPQQAAPQKKMDQAPTPVTPFGPRRKPVQGAPVPRQQAARPPVPKPEVVAKHGMWRVLCEKVPVAKGKVAKTCYVSATATDPKRKGAFVSMLLLKVKDEKGKVKGHVVNLRAPLGVFLPTGIAMEVDGKAVARAPFTRCNPVFCESTNQARKKTLDALRKGKKARFIIYAAPGVAIPLSFDLKGFSAAMKKAAELP